MFQGYLRHLLQVGFLVIKNLQTIAAIAYLSIMKPIIACIFAVFFSYPLVAQSYFQQRVDTKIEVTLDDKHHFLHGFEEMDYTNNSPDTLRYIYIHLWANAYKHDHTAFAEQQYKNGKTDFYYAKTHQRGYTDSLSFQIAGNDVGYYSDEATPDIARIDLPYPLLPGGQLKITTPFRVKIPKVFSRLGHTKQAYFVSQWFPKPAVYDRYGWHAIPYLDQGEFYSEYGSYDVRITLPDNYVVMATGNLMDKAENEWLDSLSLKALPADTLYKTTYPKSSTTFKTLHYHEDNVHDFAWFADKRWIVRKDTITVTGNDSTITAWTAFLPEYQKSWRNGTTHLKNTVKHYGQWVGPYPYKTIKAVQGDMKAGGGMEYPTVTIIEKSIGGSQDVIVHEAGHNWFYGILGSNERDHAWMDEGINSFYEMKTTAALRKEKTTTDTSGVKKLKKKGIGFTVNIDLNTTIIGQLQANAQDQAIAQTSSNFRELNYGMDVYYKTASYLGWLEEYMGASAFEAGMQAYYNLWKFKHPYPEDFKAAMQSKTDKNIDWFFDEALKTDKRIDFALKKVNEEEGKTIVTVKNNSSLALPITLKAYQKDSLLTSYTSAPFTGTQQIAIPDAKGWTDINISPLVGDTKTQNNYHSRHNGLGIGLGGFFGFNSNKTYKAWLMPAVGYNIYDGFGAGLLLHNITMPDNKLRFIVAPLYSFHSKQINGVGSVGYFWHPQNTFQEIALQADLKTFSYNETSVNIPETKFARYLKFAPSLTFTLRQPSALSTVTRSVLIKGYAINEEGFDYKLDLNDSLYKPAKMMQQKYYGMIRYQHDNHRTFNPYGYAIEAQAGANFAKLSITGNIRIDYHAPKKSLYVRAYVGKFFTIGNATIDEDRYYLNSTYTGANDYLYDETFLGRSDREGFGIRQVAIKEGGLKIPTPLYASPLGRSDNWLAAINIKTDLPLGKLPIRLFADMATFADAGKLNPSGNKILFDAGVEVYIKDVVNIYVPLIMSKDYNDYMKSIVGKDRFVKSITFSFQLGNFNWLKTSSQLFKLAGY